MVLKKSEYQNQFKSSSIIKNQSAYQENLTFRHERRDKEFVHTPIGWWDQGSEEVLSSDEETNENGNCNIRSQTKIQNDEPKYQSLAQILDESKEKSIAHRQQRKTYAYSKDFVPDITKMSLDDDDNSLQEKKSLPEMCNTVEDNLKYDSYEKKPPTNEVENSNSVPTIKCNAEKLRARSNLRRKGNSKKKRDNLHHTSERALSAPRINDIGNGHDTAVEVPSLSIGPKPRRPDRQKRIPSARCRSVIEDRPPFIAYGAGDKEDTFTIHRTHNVRSAVDVYGPALKAKMRREEEKKRQMERQKRLAQSTSDLLEKLASATPRDMIDWRSEYQKQFHGYEPKVYERSTSSRAVISHSVPIRAVHRGGSLIVHVD